MSKIMEDWKIEIEEEAKAMKAYEFALKQIKRGKLSFDEIAEDTGFTVEQVQEIAEENDIAVKA